jgi:peptidoglycan/LPS O-acetylase OafA/YrhL
MSYSIQTALEKGIGRSTELPQNHCLLWDGWRGLAIVCVLVGHFMGTSFIKDDRLGVDIFFVLSGMLMARILFEKRTDLKTFYIRRFSRIFPALLVFIALIYMLASIANWQFSALEIVANLTFVRTYFPADPHIWSGEVPLKNLWSLNVEEHAYIIMSLMTLTVINTRNAAFILFFIGIASVAFSIYYFQTQDYNETYYLLRTECAIGFVRLSSAYRLLQQRWHLKVNRWAPVVALILAALCYLTNVPFWMSFVFPPFLLAFSVNHLNDSLHFFQTILATTSFRIAGLWSYSIYLWQQPVYEYKYAIPGPDFAIPLIASVVMGALSYTLIEAPCRAFINDRWSRRSIQ